MELNVAIDPEQINKLVAEAVLQSAIGVQVEKLVKAHVDKLSQSYDNPLDSVIRGHISDLVREVLHKEHGDTLRAKVVEAVSAKITDDFVGKIISNGLSRY